MTDVVIGCDIGTQSCKALALDPSVACWPGQLQRYSGATHDRAGRSRMPAIGIAPSSA